jgi:vesicle-fusing ATPase
MKMFVYMENTSNGEANNGNSLSTSEQDALLMGNLAMNLGGKKRNEAFTSDFKSAVGGLNHQIDVIVRRVLDGRVIRPVDEDSVLTPSSSGADGSLESRTEGELTQAALEADELALLGLTPVRGLLLYGPPGCGKTALAREISRALRARAPKILSAPELLDRWVGSSEKLIRQLFADAEAELAACNGDATKSALHVIVIDEIDAVFRKRTSAEDSGEATRSSAVNQILAKLDGVNAIPNVLLIGMTNRRELLDPALLRPGRLEVQILVPKPDTEGRREILNIHFNALRKKGRLSKPLCCAIDGVKYKGSLDGENGSGKVQDIPSMRKRDKMKKILRQVSPLSNRKFDLAVATDGFSGADIAGLVRCAGSIALARTRNVGGGIDDLLITLDDVKLALKEVSL